MESVAQPAAGRQPARGQGLPGASDVFVVGTSGTALHSADAATCGPTDNAGLHLENLNAVWGRATGFKSVAAGDNGVILHCVKIQRHLGRPRPNPWTSADRRLRGHVGRHPVRVRRRRQRLQSFGTLGRRHLDPGSAAPTATPTPTRRRQGHPADLLKRRGRSRQRRGEVPRHAVDDVHEVGRPGRGMDLYPGCPLFLDLQRRSPWSALSKASSFQSPRPGGRQYKKAVGALEKDDPLLHLARLHARDQRLSAGPLRRLVEPDGSRNFTVGDTELIENLTPDLSGNWMSENSGVSSGERRVGHRRGSPVAVGDGGTVYSSGTEINY